MSELKQTLSSVLDNLSAAVDAASQNNPTKAAELQARIDKIRERLEKAEQ